jgi:hypothetical protein
VYLGGLDEGMTEEMLGDELSWFGLIDQVGGVSFDENKGGGGGGEGVWGSGWSRRMMCGIPRSQGGSVHGMGRLADM